MSNMRVEAEPTIDYLDERASAFQQTLVFMRQAYPNMAVMTYDNETHQGISHLILSKITLSVIHPSGEAEELNYRTCTEDTTCDNIPGGLKSVARTVSGQQVISELYPLITDRAPLVWEGGAVLKIKAPHAAGVVVEFGGGDLSNMHTSPNKELSGRHMLSARSTAEIKEGMVYLTHQERPITVCVCAPDFALERREMEGAAEGYGAYITATTAKNEVYMLFGFAREEERATQIASSDPASEVQRVEDYYEAALKHWSICTPDQALDEAFRHARLNLEYSWFRPYGWIESIHHWPTMWHMEQTAADEWAGYCHRTRETLQSQLDHLLPSGAVPDMCCDGSTRHDWGGNNQFFFRELHHYVKMTGDIEFLQKNEHFLYTILEQTFHDYDPAGKGVLSWDTQIGNQEDMESSPGPAAAPGSEGVRMLELMSVFMGWLGHEDKAAYYMERSAYCLEQWKKTIIKSDIARPIWFEDVNGQKRLDTTYHGLSYPVIYNQVDDFYKVSFMDHLLHRLSGEYGEMFQSNHFGDHAYDTIPTWGMQAGSDMQPFATAAYAQLGYCNEAVKPLSFIADKVCSPYQRGSWPEAANETRFAYFSPSAGVYAQGVIESIFGIDQNVMDGVTTIAPCFPEDWDHAELEVTGAQIKYGRKGNRHVFGIDIANDTKKVFIWRIKPFEKIKITVDGKRVRPRITYGCGWFEVEAELTTAQQHIVTVQYTPIDIRVDYAQSVACGDSISLRVSGAELLGIEDRCGIFEQLNFNSGAFTATVREGLLDEYAAYGWIGVMNFARRVFALKVKAGQHTFMYPCVLTVVPPLVCQATEKDGKVHVKVVNNTATSFTQGALYCGGGEVSLGSAFDALSITEEDVTLESANLTLGKNKARLVLMSETKRQTLAFELECETPYRSICQIPLQEEMLLDKSRWREVCDHDNHGFSLIDPDVFMKGLLDEVKEITFEGIGSFTLNEKGFIPLRMTSKRIVEIPLTGIRTRKLYIVLCGFVDNHSAFSNVFNVELEAEKGDSFIKPYQRKQLTIPGQLDTGFGNEVLMGLFSSYMPGVERGVMPEFPLGRADYPDTVCPKYPARELRCDNRAVFTCNTVLNLIEIELNGVQTLETLRLICNQADAAGGIFALGYAEEK